MGCGVALAYWDLYRDDRLRRLVLIDQPAAPISQPDWPEGDDPSDNAVRDVADLAFPSAEPT